MSRVDDEVSRFGIRLSVVCDGRVVWTPSAILGDARRHNTPSQPRD
jgi:hypothetical protein